MQLYFLLLCKCQRFWILVKFTYRAKIIYRSFVHRSTTISFLEQRKSEENLDST
jgi:hypothetical protein